MKRIYLLLLALAALTACSKDAEQTPGVTDGRIRVVAGVAATRAVTDASTGLTGASFVVVEGGATVPASFASGTLYTGDVAAATGVVTFTSTTAPTYNMNDANAWFAAYAPGGALTGDAIEWTIDGQTDIMVTNNVWNAGKYTAPVTTGLTFSHQLSQVEVICQAENGQAAAVIESAWGKITKIEFVGAPAKMKYDLNAAPTISTSGSADLPLLAKYDGTALSPLAIPAYGSTTINAVAMVAPVAATATESFKLKVTTSGAAATPAKPIEVVIPISLSGTQAAMTAGRRHKVTITFQADGLEIKATASVVDDWTDGTGGGVEAERPATPPSVGDYAYSDGTFSTALTRASKTVIGMVFWVNRDDPTNFKVCSLDEPSAGWYNGNQAGCLPWSTEEDTTDATDEDNGMKNMTAVKAKDATLAKFPAFGWCDSKNKDGQSGWYLPALSELEYLWCAYNDRTPVKWDSGNAPAEASANTSAQGVWNVRLTAAAGTPLSTVFMPLYLASTETAANTAYYILMNSGLVSSGADKIRENASFVRCIREFPTPPAVGDYYYSDGTFSTELKSGKTPVGVVFWVNPDNPRKYKIHSLDEPSASWSGGTNAAGYLVWSKKDEVTGATDTDDGMTNMAAVKVKDATLADYPAFKWCDDKNTGGQSGWYMPALSELQYLWCAFNGYAPVKWPGSRPEGVSGNETAQKAWNDRLTAAGVGGTRITASISYYWSSTEKSKGIIYFMDFSDGSIGDYAKMIPYGVRCIRVN